MNAWDNLIYSLVGKFTEGWTDIARKGGNVIGSMGIDASMPGKSARHLTSFIDTYVELACIGKSRTDVEPVVTRNYSSVQM